MNIKRITAFAAAFVLSLGVLAAVPEVWNNYSGTVISASAKEVDGFVIETDSEGKKFVSGYNGKGGDIRIPDGVEYVAENAFFCDDTWGKKAEDYAIITGLTFPKSCTEVKNQLFNLSGLRLKTVVFEGDAKIGNYAFDCCYGLEKVTVIGSIKEHIGQNAFSNCYYLRSVQIKKNKYEFTIDLYAFGYCHSLTAINIPSKCTYIDNYAFRDCYKLKKLTIPANTRIGGQHTFGYAGMYMKLDKNGEPVGDMEFFVADGKKSGYELHYDRKEKIFKYVKFTPARLTLTVTKGSPAEKYAKENGIKYQYAKSKTSKS